MDEALAYLKQALEINPNNGYYLDSLGWIYYKQGKYRQALKVLKKAVENLEKPDAVVLTHMGDAYAALRRYKKAAETYENSLKMERNPAVEKKLRDAKKKIKSQKSGGGN